MVFRLLFEHLYNVTNRLINFMICLKFYNIFILILFLMDMIYIAVRIYRLLRTKIISVSNFFYQLIFFLGIHLFKRALYFASKISLGGNSGSLEYKSAFWKAFNKGNNNQSFSLANSW